MQPSTHELQFSSVEVDYQPSPETVAGFIQTMAEKVNELLSAAEWEQCSQGLVRRPREQYRPR